MVHVHEIVKYAVWNYSQGMRNCQRSCPPTRSNWHLSVMPWVGEISHGEGSTIYLKVRVAVNCVSIRQERYRPWMLWKQDSGLQGRSSISLRSCNPPPHQSCQEGCSADLVTRSPSCRFCFPGTRVEGGFP